MLRLCSVLSIFSIILSNCGEVHTKKEADKLTLLMKTKCKQCTHIFICPMICGKNSTKPTIKPPPTKLPPTSTPIFPPTPRPPTLPPLPPVTPAPPIIPPSPSPPTKPSPLPPATPAPPIIPPSPPPPTKPSPLPPATPAPPIIPSPPPPTKPSPPQPATPAPPIIPSPAPPTKPSPLPPATPAPPIIPSSPPPTTPTSPSGGQEKIRPPSPVTQAPPVIVPTSAPVPPPSPSIPGELSCLVRLEKKGCFKDDQIPPRPLPNYILTDRDNTLSIYSGKGIDWGNWVNYLPDFVCRCAQLTKSKNFKYFGIQYYGECWSGPSGDENSFKEDGVSTECVNTNWKTCSDQSKLACAGKEKNNYVYAIV